MCEYCRQIPCDPRCPNAEEPKGIAECSVCGGQILFGEEYIETEEGEMHLDCWENLPTRKMAEVLGVEIKKEGGDDW